MKCWDETIVSHKYSYLLTYLLVNTKSPIVSSGKQDDTVISHVRLSLADLGTEIVRRADHCARLIKCVRQNPRDAEVADL